MGEAVADESKLALLDVLLDGVEEFLLGDLEGTRVSDDVEGYNTRGKISNDSIARCREI